jgi:hypothetical protein
MWESHVWCTCAAQTRASFGPANASEPVLQLQLQLVNNGKTPQHAWRKTARKRHDGDHLRPKLRRSCTSSLCITLDNAASGSRCRGNAAQWILSFLGFAAAAAALPLRRCWSLPPAKHKLLNDVGDNLCRTRLVVLPMLDVCLVGAFAQGPAHQRSLQCMLLTRCQHRVWCFGCYC